MMPQVNPNLLHTPFLDAIFRALTRNAATPPRPEKEPTGLEAMSLREHLRRDHEKFVRRRGGGARRNVHLRPEPVGSE